MLSQAHPRNSSFLRRVLLTLVANTIGFFSCGAQNAAKSAPPAHAPIALFANENAFGYSPMAMAAMEQTLPEINRYAWEETPALVAAIAQREGVPADHVFLTAGSTPILKMAGMAYGAPGKNVVTVEPGYLDLTDTFKAFGGDVKAVPLNADLAYDLPALAAAVDANTALIYICNPANPTGTLIAPAALAAFITRLPDHVVVFVDEAYMELADGGIAANSMIALARERENVIVTRTFSKVYGMASLRVGYGIMAPATKAKMLRYSTGGPNKLACVAALAAMQDDAFFTQNVANYQRVRAKVTQRLDALGVAYAQPQGSYVFMHTGIPAQEFVALMATENIKVGRPFPPMLDWCRVSLGTDEEMMIYLDTFERILRERGRL